MRTNSVIALSTVCVCAFLSACAHNPPAGEPIPSPVCASNTALVTMGQPPARGRKIVVYKTDIVHVVNDYADFLRNLDSTIVRLKVPADERLKEWIAVRTVGGDSIMLHHLSPRDEIGRRARYRLADLLQGGKGAIYDVQSGARITQIMVETCSDKCAQSPGQAGRRFLLPDRRVFLEVPN